MTLIFETHITINEAIRSGKPIIMGSRITVSDIVILHFKLGDSLEEIAAKYDLPLASVYAAIAYYYDNKAAIDKEVETGRTIYQRNKSNARSLLKEKLENYDSE